MNWRSGHRLREWGIIANDYLTNLKLPIEDYRQSDKYLTLLREAGLANFMHLRHRKVYQP